MKTYVTIYLLFSKIPQGFLNFFLVTLSAKNMEALLFFNTHVNENTHLCVKYSFV